MRSLVFSALAFAALVLPAAADEISVTFTVPGMTCASCPFLVEAAMLKVDGVISVDADFDARIALVVFDDDITGTDAIADASNIAGYEAILIEAES